MFHYLKWYDGRSHKSWNSKKRSLCYQIGCPSIMNISKSEALFLSVLLRWLRFICLKWKYFMVRKIYPIQMICITLESQSRIRKLQNGYFRKVTLFAIQELTAKYYIRKSKCLPRRFKNVVFQKRFLRFLIFLCYEPSISSKKHYYKQTDFHGVCSNKS